MIRLLFQDPEGLEGTFTTVRRAKEEYYVSEGTEVELLDVSGSLLGRGRVVDTPWRGQFGRVPAALVEMEHLERARTYSGLLDVMRQIYGDRFDERDRVVVLTIEVAS